MVNFSGHLYRFLIPDRAAVFFLTHLLTALAIWTPLPIYDSHPGRRFFWTPLPFSDSRSGGRFFINTFVEGFGYLDTFTDSGHLDTVFDSRSRSIFSEHLYRFPIPDRAAVFFLTHLLRALAIAWLSILGGVWLFG